MRKKSKQRDAGQAREMYDRQAKDRQTATLKKGDKPVPVTLPERKGDSRDLAGKAAAAEPLPHAITARLDDALVALSQLQDELQEIRAQVDRALGRRRRLLFCWKGGVLIALLPRDEHGRLREPDGKDILSISDAAKLTGRPERELVVQWIATWAETLGDAALNEIRVAEGLAPVVDEG
jgi:hypothetical protein